MTGWILLTIAGGGIHAITLAKHGPTHAVDSTGNLLIAEYTRIRNVTNGVITTVAGEGSSLADNIPATSAQLGSPNFNSSVALDGAGNLFIADYSNHRIRKVSNGVETTVAGNGTPGYSGDNGPATGAQLNVPTGVAVDLAGKPLHRGHVEQPDHGRDQMNTTRSTARFDVNQCESRWSKPGSSRVEFSS